MNRINIIPTRLFIFAFLLCGLITVQASAAPQPAANGEIAFTSDRDGNSEIYVMNADGSGQTRLTNNSVRDDYPTWSPDGKTIAFLRQGGGVSSINLMNADGTNVRQITTLTLPGYLFGISWSPDGTKIAFNDARDIFIVNLDGSNRVNLTSGQSGNYTPSWSPDGSRIAFARFLDIYASSIHTMNADGSDVKQITRYCEGYCGITSPDWSPDGGRIAFLSNADSDSNEPSGILLVNPDGTNQQINPFGFAPKWSPDGTKIVLYETGYYDRLSQIWLMNRDGSGLTQLTNNSPNNFNPDWQPLAPQTSFTVTRSDDRNNGVCTPGDCSLREAVNAANASATDDTINFALGLTRITLTDEIVINNAGSLTVTGPGANNLTIDGGAGTNRIFYTNLATITVSGMTLTGGSGTGAMSSGYGGAIFAQGGSLTLNSVYVKGNFAKFNKSGGGVVFQNGRHHIINSTFAFNIADGDCGGFSNDGGTLTVVNSTISGNIASKEYSYTAAYAGGGFCNSGDVTLRNVTITNNTAAYGGGITNTGSLNFANTIVAYNYIVSGAVFVDGDFSEIEYASGTITSAGGNLVGDSLINSFNTGAFIIAYHPTDILGANPMLGSLAYNGGATPTHALLVGSPAIDKGVNSLAQDPFNNSLLQTDQRGLARIVGSAVDIGAFEFAPAKSRKRVRFF